MSHQGDASREGSPEGTPCSGWNNAPNSSRTRQLATDTEEFTRYLTQNDLSFDTIDWLQQDQLTRPKMFELLTQKSLDDFIARKPNHPDETHRSPLPFGQELILRSLVAENEKKKSQSGTSNTGSSSQPPNDPAIVAQGSQLPHPAPGPVSQQPIPPPDPRIGAWPSHHAPQPTAPWHSRPVTQPHAAAWPSQVPAQLTNHPRPAAPQQSLTGENALQSLFSGPTATPAHLQQFSAGAPTIQPAQILLGSQGKTSDFYDITDFVPGYLVEKQRRELPGTDGCLVLETGPKKPNLDKLTLSQWNMANARIQARLISDGALPGYAVTQYLAHTVKINQLTDRYVLNSVFIFDREFRRHQAENHFPWDHDIRHLADIHLIPRRMGNVTSAPQKPAPIRRKDPNNPSREICNNFNIGKCTYSDCNRSHVCLNCAHPHPQISCPKNA